MNSCSYLSKGAYLFNLIILLQLVINLPLLSAQDATITVYCDRTSSWQVDKLLHGRFFEHHRNDVYPGIYEQYIINSSFEKWYHKDEDSPTPFKDVKPWLTFNNIRPLRGLAYPWEAVGKRDNRNLKLSTDAFNSDRAQQITNLSSSAIVGIKQRLALPDYRIDKYYFSFWAKSMAGEVKIQVKTLAHGQEEEIHQLDFDLKKEWKLCKGLIDLRDKKAKIKVSNRHGVYDLLLTIEQQGSVLIDQATIFPADAVEGVWNPETIDHLKSIGVTTIRWPGGNFASGYNWQDGIGPLEGRPTRPNLAWAGLEPNHVGTDEFMYFCEITGLIPLVCVGFDYCTPEEAAAWVEYCNGSPNTLYGALRTKNGRKEPYNVELWQVGNEVYGHYQTGYTTADDYAKRFLDYKVAMKQVDPTIKIIAMGRDPGYPSDDNNDWNRELFRVIGSKMDYIDIHRYVRGFRHERNLAGWDMTQLAETYLSFSTQYDSIIHSIDLLRGKYNAPNVKLAVTEWAQYPSLDHPQLPHKFSQANSVFYASMLNSFIRNGSFVRISCSHDFSIFVSNHKDWNVPVLPRSYVANLYSDVSADRLLEIEVDSETFDMKRDVTQMLTINNIPYLDAVALSTANSKEIVLFIVNRSLTSAYNVMVNLKNVTGKEKAQARNVSLVATDDPMRGQNWTDPKVFEMEESIAKIKNNAFEFTASSCSVSRVTITK